MVLNLNDPETVWNVFRFGNKALVKKQKEESKICSISTMEEMLQLVEESDKVLAFG